jgi:hypothetical protein
VTKQKIVVLTGPCVLSDGTRFLRETLSQAASKVGYLVPKGYDARCVIVVASRDDTVKARKAAAEGKLVISYDGFVHMLRQMGADPSEWTCGAKEDPFVDKAPEQLKSGVSTTSGEYTL